MAAASDELPLTSLRTTVDNLIDTISRLTEQVSGLMAPAGGEYEGDAGPAVRARFFEHSRESDRFRMDELNDMVAGLEATMAEIANI